MKRGSRRLKRWALSAAADVVTVSSWASESAVGPRCSPSALRRQCMIGLLRSKRLCLIFRLVSICQEDFFSPSRSPNAAAFQRIWESTSTKVDTAPHLSSDIIPTKVRRSLLLTTSVSIYPVVFPSIVCAPPVSKAEVTRMLPNLKFVVV